MIENFTAQPYPLWALWTEYDRSVDTPTFEDDVRMDSIALCGRVLGWAPSLDTDDMVIVPVVSSRWNIEVLDRGETWHHGILEFFDDAESAESARKSRDESLHQTGRRMEATRARRAAESP